MWIARLAWSLPLLALCLVVAQVVHVVRVLDLSAAAIVVLAAFDLAFLAVVVHLCRVLRRGGPLTLTTTLIGMFGVGIFASQLFPTDPDRFPVATGLRFGLQASAFVLTAWAWVRSGNRRESGSLRPLLALGLLALLGVWALLAFVGLTRTEGAFALRLLGLLGIAAPVLAYFVHLARHLSRRVRLSDGMLLVGLFLVLPAGYVGPLLILGGPGWPAAVLWLYVGVPAFAAMAIAWSKGTKAGSPTAGAAAALLCVAVLGLGSCAEGDGRRKFALNQINEFEKAAEFFHVDYSRYPTTLDELTGDHAEFGYPDGYLTEISLDPWGREYLYYPHGGRQRPYLILSKGEDGVEGTEDDIASEKVAAGVDVGASRRRGMRATAANRIKEIEKAVNLFCLDYSRYPETLEELTGDHAEFGYPDGYMAEIPLDPWGEEYVYDPAGGTWKAYRILSKGEDRIEGTDDDLTSE